MLTLLLLLLCIGIECRFTREPKCGNTKHFRFDKELPAYHQDLSYCQYYRGETCCNKTHTDKIIKHIYGYAQRDLTIECRNIGLNIGCSPCDPRIGTNQIDGICHNYCNKWYNACKNDYFHYNSRGLLTACSVQTDLICTRLSSIIKNGTQLCQQSGYDISYTSIKCYDGKRPKLKAIPKDLKYITPFEQVWNAFKKTKLWKNIKLLLRKYQTLPLWQQILVISGIIYTIFAVFKGILSGLTYIFPPIKETPLPFDVFNTNQNEMTNDERNDFIRNKRLEALMRKRELNQQMNLEKDMAKKLGLAAMINTDDDTDIIYNDDISLSDDQDDVGTGYTAEQESDDE